MTIAPDQTARDIALITQMRAGTHFLCGALCVALEATIYRPDRDSQFVVMDDAYIRKGLREDGQIALPATRSDLGIYFAHYYHPQASMLSAMRRIYLIGFPFDSFYSDAVVASQNRYDPGPSGPRAGDYVLCFGSSEWKFLEGRMRENAEWLMKIADGDGALVVRYEDFFGDFEACVKRLGEFLGGFINPFPRPVLNPRRTYWTEDYASAFDPEALSALWRLFAPAVERFYPEQLTSLRAAL